MPDAQDQPNHTHNKVDAGEGEEERQIAEEIRRKKTI